MRYYDLSVVKKLIPKLSTYVSLSKPTAKQTAALFDDLLLALNSPQPPKELYPYFLKPSIISELIRVLHNKCTEYRDIIKNLDRLVCGSSPHFYRIRSLGAYGNYPNQRFLRRDQAYIIQDGLPYMITKNTMSAETAAGTFYNEIGHITRSEIKLAASFIAAEGHNGLCLYFDGSTRDANAQIIEDIPAQLLYPFLVEYALLFNTIEDNYHLYDSHHPQPSRSHYEFQSFSNEDRNFLEFNDRFRLNDFLLLRVATYLVKGTMLWRPEPFREESLANIFFALEGCLLLLQRKHGLGFERIDRKKLPGVFNTLFQQGEDLFDFIDEATGWGGRRASIVHPQVDNDHSWLPPLSAEDYYDYQEIVRMLLNYVLTDHIYKEYQKINTWINRE